MENNSTKLFQLALGISDPWYVSLVRFEDLPNGKRELYIGMNFKRGSKFLAEDGTEHTAFDTVEREWEHLNFFEHRCCIHARVPRIRFDNWVLDTAQRELVTGEGVSVPLSAGEFRLLVAFLERPRVSLTRDQLLDLTQGRSLEPFDRSVDSAVSRLRRKIEDDARAPRIIKTVYGGGYVFAADPVAA